MRIFWVILVVAATLSGVAQALYPSWAINKAIDKAYADLEYMGNVQNMIVGRHPTLQHHGGEADPERCGFCIMGVVRHIMTAVEDHLKEICAETKCPFLKKKCELAKLHPGIAHGFLLDHVHAFDKSYAFCYGRGVCPHPGPHGQCCCGEHCSTQLSEDGEDFHVIVEMMNLDRLTTIAPLLAKNEEEKNQTCVECIEGTTHCVIEAMAEKAKEFCEKAECPCIKRRCEWAMAHKDIALGILISRTHPGGWGCGYCFGKGKCHVPKPEEAEHINMAEILQKVVDKW